MSASTVKNISRMNVQVTQTHMFELTQALQPSEHGYGYCPKMKHLSAQEANPAH